MFSRVLDIINGKNVHVGARGRVERVVKIINTRWVEHVAHRIAYQKPVTSTPDHPDHTHQADSPSPWSWH